MVVEFLDDTPRQGLVASRHTPSTKPLDVVWQHSLETRHSPGIRKQGSIDKIPAHTECWRQQLHRISPSQLLGLRMEHHLRNLDQLAGEAVAESHNNCILALRRYCVGLLRHSVRFRDDFKLQTAANLIVMAISSPTMVYPSSYFTN